MVAGAAWETDLSGRSARSTLRGMKSFVVLLALALLFPACARHSPPRPKAQRLRRAPGESAEDFAERKEEVREYQKEVREARKENAENAKNQTFEPLGGQ